MKKILLVLFLIFSPLLLSSCDYPEKSFSALDDFDIPIEVNNDFFLPRGIYGKFIWTSNNDAIKIVEADAFVTQSFQDVLVTITATINKKSKSFDILVLKLGSITVYEKATSAEKYLFKHFDTLTSEILLMPKELEGLYLKYSNAFSSAYISHFMDDDSNTYLSNNFKEALEEEFVYVYFYKDQAFETLVYITKLYFKVSPMEDRDPFMLAFKAININNYYYSNGLIEINNLKVNDIIEFSDDETISYLLTYFPKIIEKISYNKLKIIKVPKDENYYNHQQIIIKIGNMRKSISIKLSFDE